MSAQPENQQSGPLPLTVQGIVEPGVYYDVPEVFYRSAPAISNSQLKIFADDPCRYYHQFVANTIEGKESSAKDFGRVAHTIILEPDTFESRYEKAPDLNKNTKAYKEAVKEIEAGGKEAISTEHWDKAILIRDRVYADDHAAKLLLNGKSEVSVFGTHEASGLAGKIRIDRLSDSGFIVDLKTTAVSIDNFSFARLAARLRYHWQDAFYTPIAIQQGIKRGVFVWIVVEVEPPFNVKVFSMDQHQRDQAKCQVDYWMKQLALAYQENQWPSYHSGTLQTLNIPDWALQVPGQDYYNG